MKFRNYLAISGVTLSAFLVAGPFAMAQNVDAQGMPTTSSTPAEQAQTLQLNQNAADAAAGANSQAASQASANDTQNQVQQMQYQNQQGTYEAQKEDYDAKMVAYDALRDRYATERAAYHRDLWPDSYTNRLLMNDAGLIDSRVEVVNGDTVGRVTDIARGPNGHIDALRVALDNGQITWVDAADVRFDHDAGIVMTDLSRNDLNAMTEEHM
jgi:hypothetical protein